MLRHRYPEPDIFTSGSQFGRFRSKDLDTIRLWLTKGIGTQLDSDLHIIRNNSRIVPSLMRGVVQVNFARLPFLYWTSCLKVCRTINRVLVLRKKGGGGALQ